MKPCVITFAKGAERYLTAVRRLKDSFAAYDIPVLAFSDESELPGNYRHADVPYAFKAMAFVEALNNGYDTVLWCDSVVYAKGDPRPVFDYIHHNGLLLFDNIGYSVHDYTSDSCLDHYGMSRATAKEVPMIMACCMGVSLYRGGGADKRRASNKAWEFAKKYISAAEAVPSPYAGPWSNETGEASTDETVQGHRHDQSVASILAHQLGVELLTGHETFFTYEGHPGMEPVAPSVTLFSK